MAHFVVEPAPGTERPARESIVLVDGARRVVVASDLAVGAADVGGRLVDHGYGLDAWDVGDAWVARIAAGHRDPETGDGASSERFLVSRDAGATWSELDPGGARDLEHRRHDESRIARIDRWPGGFC